MDKKIVTLNPADRLIYKDSCLFVNGRPFITTYPDESVDWIVGIEDNQLVTGFKGRSMETSKWKPEEISGYYIDKEGLKLNEDNKLIGGVGDATAPSELDPKELAMGVAVEMAEHTHDEKIATEIAIDHLTRNPHYYTKLNQAGLTDEFSHVSPSGYGDPDSEFNNSDRLGDTVTCSPGNNIVGGMDKTPDGHIDGKRSSTPIVNKTIDIDVQEPTLNEGKGSEVNYEIDGATTTAYIHKDYIILKGGWLKHGSKGPETARRLIQKIVSEHPTKTIAILVDETRKTLIQFYKRCGFEIVRKHPLGIGIIMERKPTLNEEKNIMNKYKKAIHAIINEIMSESNVKIGDTAKISHGSGIDSGKVVTIVDKSNIKTDGRGAPTNVSGAYKPIDWNKEVAIKYVDGTFGTMFKNRLQKVQKDQGENSHAPEMRVRSDEPQFVDSSVDPMDALQEAKKWIKKAIHKSRVGMFKDYTSSELQAALSKAKKASKAHKEKGEKVPHKLRTKISQLVFAIRAKGKKGLKESVEDTKNVTRQQIEAMLKEMLDMDTPDSQKKAGKLRNKLIHGEYLTTEDILKETQRKMVKVVHDFAKKHFMNEKLVLRRKDDKIYVISDDTKEKEKPFKDWETVRNKSKLRAAGFSYDGVGWWIYATKLKEAQEIIAKINESPIEKFIDKVEDLLEFEQETKDFTKKEELGTKIEGFIDKLASEVDAVKASAEFKAYITFASKFYSYSFNNTLLIYIQRPNAKKVGSFGFWKKLNRHVKKGAKAIWIYTPLTVKNDDFDGSQTSGLDSAVSKSKVVGFKPSMVFDITDTEASNEKGNVPEAPKWHGNDEPEEKADKLTEYGLKLADNLGIKVDREAAERGEKGWASKDHINIVTGIAGAGAFGTLIHEIAHSLMHFKETSPFFIDRKEFPATKEEMELEAETVSYIILNHYGLDAKHHPVYLAQWKANKEAFQKSLKSITRVSKFIILELDKIASPSDANPKVSNEPETTTTA